MILLYLASCFRFDLFFKIFSEKLSFLVGVFEENARLLQWLVFFRQFNAIGPLFCSFVQLLGRLIFLVPEKQEVRFSH